MQTREALEKTLAKIRKEELVQTSNPNHIAGFAIPIYKNKQIIASLSVFLPESRVSPANKVNIIKSMQRTGNKIKDRLNKDNV